MPEEDIHKDQQEIECQDLNMVRFINKQYIFKPEELKVLKFQEHSEEEIKKLT